MPTRLSMEAFWSYDTFLFDVDGVLCAGNHAIHGAPELIDLLLKTGKRVLLVTNNSSTPPEECLKKYRALGFSGLFIKFRKKLNGRLPFEHHFILK